MFDLTTEHCKTDQSDIHPQRQGETRSTISALMPLMVARDEGSCVERKRGSFEVIDAQRQAKSKLKKSI